MPLSSLTFRITLLSFSILWVSPSFAAGIANDAQSVSAMGNAFAGAGAAGDDASIMYYNPAGLALIEEPQVVLSGIYAIPHSELTVDYANDSFGNPIPNSEGKQYDAAPAQFSPAFYAATPIDERFTLGMSLNSPYNLWTDYSDSDVVSNTARQTQFFTYTGALNLAMAVDDHLTIGVGANVQYFKAKMNALPSASHTQNNVTLALDGMTEYNGDDVGFYPTVGILYEFTKATRVGLNYRAPVNHNTRGDFSNDLSFTLTQPGDTQHFDANINSAASSLFKLPDLFSINLFHQLTDSIELLSDLTFTHWGRMQDVIVTSTDPIFLDVTEPIDSHIAFQNTWRFGLGANYLYNSELKFRVGAAYDESPVTDEYRTLQGPDSDRVDVAIGASYKPKTWEDLYVDVAYMHTFFDSGTVNQFNPLAQVIPPITDLPNLHSNTAGGSFSTYADYLGLQIVYVM